MDNLLSCSSPANKRGLTVSLLVIIRDMTSGIMKFLFAVRNCFCTNRNTNICYSGTGREPVMALFLDLQDFLLRAQVLKLYRQALRTARRAPAHARAELSQMIRQEMENNRNCCDKQRIRFLISEGRVKLKGLDEMLDMQGL